MSNLNIIENVAFESDANTSTKIVSGEKEELDPLLFNEQSTCKHTVNAILSLPRTEEQLLRIEQQHEEVSHERVALSTQAFFEQLKSTGKYTKETLSLFEKLAHTQNESDYRAAVEKIMSSYDLISKRLERAVEVDFRAYLPQDAPVLYNDWKKEPKNKGKNAIDCLNEYYGHYLQKGVLFQDDLGGKEGLDLPLSEAIKNFCKRNKLKTSDIIPPKTERTTLLAHKVDKRKAMIIKGLYSALIKT